MLLQYFVIMGLPMVAYILFWTVALKRHWRYLRLLALTTTLALLTITLLLYQTDTENFGWILDLGGIYALFVGFIILSLPKTAPGFLKQIDFKW
jgi:hypothetical protein